MLEILLLIWIGRTFSKFAKANNLSSGLWATLGVLSYIVGEVLGVILLIIMNPRGLDNIALVYVYGLPIAAGLTFLTYYLMKQAAKNNVPSAETEILDEDLLSD